MIPAHELTFDQLIASTEAVFTTDGLLIAGKDRKAELNSPAGINQTWLKWQKECFKNDLAPHVMEYYQKTLHLTRPPKGPDDFRKDNSDYAKGRELALKISGPPFTWSFSSLSTFETCPLKMAGERYYKTTPYEETVATIWGTRVHTAAEKYMRGDDVTDAEAFEVVKPYVTLFEKIPGEKQIERMFCIDENWKHLESRDGAACTAFVDLGILNGDKVLCVDWKTGKKKDDTTQLRFYCLLYALKYPELQQFEAKYIWLKEKSVTSFSMTRKDLLPVFKELKERVAKMKDAWDNEVFVPRRNGLCRKYCGNRDCPHAGA